MPSLNFRVGIDPVCFGPVPLVAAGWNVDPIEFILEGRRVQMFEV